MTPKPFRICFVCTGNICRSPMGEIIFRALAERAGLGDHFTVTSRGTGGWHVGHQADRRARDALAEAGFDPEQHRAAQLTAADIKHNDLLIALAEDHLAALAAMGAAPSQLALMTEFDPDRPDDPDVFDPYYSDGEAFAAVREQMERSCARLLEELRGRV